MFPIFSKLQATSFLYKIL